MSESSGTRTRILVLLLKTKSTPADGYEAYFSREIHKRGFEPVFVPVLEHRFEESGLKRARKLLHDRQISGMEGEYGGLIFTSQRAVEGFAKIVKEGRGIGNISPSAVGGWPHLQNVPIYTVGPATSRALKAVPQDQPLAIFGTDTGNGEALAHFMLDHYGDWYKELPAKPSLLFLVGEQRRDIIPKTLMDPNLPAAKRIPVEELVVYETGVMVSFEEDFRTVLRHTEDREVRWVVVFSPTGCEAMLRSLGMLDRENWKLEPGKVSSGKKERKTYIATIGPTTRDHLRTEFGFEPDVCAARPSPEGVGEGISRFMDSNLRE